MEEVFREDDPRLPAANGNHGAEGPTSPRIGTGGSARGETRAGLPLDAHGSCFGVRKARTIRRVLFGVTMPRTPSAGLCFLLGLLLAFYVFVPFLERAVR